MRQFQIQLDGGPKDFASSWLGHNAKIGLEAQVRTTASDKRIDQAALPPCWAKQTMSGWFLPDAEICPCTPTMSWLVAKTANQPTNFAFGDTNILSTPRMRPTVLTKCVSEGKVGLILGVLRMFVSPKAK